MATGMARPVRLKFEGAAYGVLTRGNHGKSAYGVAMLARTVRNRREQGRISRFTARPLSIHFLPKFGGLFKV